MSTTSDLITGALRLLAEPVEDTPEAGAAWQARVEAWVAASESKLAALYCLHRAAKARSAEYEAEASRWACLVASEQRTASWAWERARDLLVTERRLAGYGDDEPYLVTLPNGVKPRLALNPPAVEIDPGAALPAELQREIPARVEPDKVAIKAVLATGAEVPGCRLTRSQRFEWGEPRTRGGVR